MNKKSLKTMAIISIFLLSNHAVVASAGTKPSPVQSEIKQLDAVTKSLNKINARLEKILDNPPDDTMPSPNVNGAVGRLGVMTHHLEILKGFIASSIKVLGNPPSDQEGGSALEGVGDAAQGIFDNIVDYLDNRANVATPPEFIYALNDVKTLADNIVKSTINQPADCSIYIDEDDCNKDPECTWQPPMPADSGGCKES